MSRAKVIRDPADLRRRIEEERAGGRTVVFANGCFDVIHVGHVRYLEGAAKEGDILVVAVNTDTSYRRNRNRDPHVPEGERIEIISAIGCVDYVVPLDDPTADGLIRLLKPEVHAKGTDYRVETVTERETVESYGGRVAIVGDPKDHSTTEMVKRIRGEEEG
jgi:rfaE bifunctional protein nucleotidyltransferase chain/domain